MEVQLIHLKTDATSMNTPLIPEWKSITQVHVDKPKGHLVWVGSCVLGCVCACLSMCWCVCLCLSGSAYLCPWEVEGALKVKSPSSPAGERTACSWSAVNWRSCDVWIKLRVYLYVCVWCEKKKTPDLSGAVKSSHWWRQETSPSGGRERLRTELFRVGVRLLQGQEGWGRGSLCGWRELPSCHWRPMPCDKHQCCCQFSPALAPPPHTTATVMLHMCQNLHCWRASAGSGLTLTRTLLPVSRFDSRAGLENEAMASRWLPQPRHQRLGGRGLSSLF